MAEERESPPNRRPPDPGGRVRTVTGWVVVLLVGSLVLHIATSPKPAELTPDEGPAAESAEPTPTAWDREEATVTTVADTAGGNPLSVDRAMGYLQAICDLGPRPTGSEAMSAQQQMVRAHFESFGATVEMQRFKGPDPRVRGRRVRMANLVARWRPDATRRVLLCAHYDTRPLPDRDPDRAARRTGVFLGANDGASGVAVLMELAHLMPSEFAGPSVGPDPLGVDFALFDAEEFVFADRDPYFLGSRWFGQQYKKREALPAATPGAEPRPWRYEAAVLLDMVGDADLQVFYEGHSFARRDTRQIVHQVWDVAERLGVREFVPKVRHRVEDDHVALRKYGGIPAIDIIDFDYPHWHTTRDTPEHCSGESLAKVGWVVWEWLLDRAHSPADAT